MITIKVNSTFGLFAFSAEAAVSEEQRDALAVAGLLQLLQRSPATKAEKALAVAAGFAYDKKRPDGFKRTLIDFSDKAAEMLKGFLEDVKVEIAGVEQALAVEVSVSEYEPEATATKWAAEKAKIASKAGDAAALKKMASVVGYAGEDLTEGNVEFCRAIRDWVKAQMAGI